jgi:hypothetical protein
MQGENESLAAFLKCLYDAYIQYTPLNSEIQRLLTAVQKPQAVAVVHVPGHQSAQTLEATGNSRANEAARNAALASTTLALTLPMPELPRLPP